MDNSTSSFIFGIDIGTSKSCISICFNHSKYQLCPLEYNKYYIPSIVYYDADNKAYIGYPPTNNIIHSVTRYPKKDISIPENYNAFTSILKYLRDKAIEYFSYTGDFRCIMGVPVNFNESHRQILFRICKELNIIIIRLVSEPVCAVYKLCITYPKVIVYDLGGGTLDITMLEYLNDMNIYKVEETFGNNNIGCDKINDILFQFLTNKWCLLSISDIDKINLMNEIEQKKRYISSNEIEAIQFVFENYKYLMTKSDILSLCSEWLEQCTKPLLNMLDNISENDEEVNSIVLVGSGSKFYLIMNELERIQHQYNIKLIKETSLEYLVSLGASLFAYNITNKNDSKAISLIDKCAFSISVEINYGILETIVPVNSFIPCKYTKEFTSCDASQDSIMIKLYQGVSRLVKYNTLIKEYKVQVLTDIKPKVSITIDINENHMIEVIIYEKLSGYIIQESLLTDILSNNIAQNTDNKLEELQVKMIQQLESHIQTIKIVDKHSKNIDIFENFINLILACENTFQLLDIQKIIPFNNINSESIHSESIHSESIHSESIHLESIHLESIHLESIHSESIHSESIHSEPVNELNSYYDTINERIDFFNLVGGLKTHLNDLEIVDTSKQKLSTYLNDIIKEVIELESNTSNLSEISYVTYIDKVNKYCELLTI